MYCGILHLVRSIPHWPTGALINYCMWKKSLLQIEYITILSIKRPNVFDVGPTLYKCYTNVFLLAGIHSVRGGVLTHDRAVSKVSVSAHGLITQP